MSDVTIRPESGGLIELETFRSDDADDEPSIMLSITAPQPRTEHFAISPAVAKRLALALLDQVDNIEQS